MKPSLLIVSFSMPPSPDIGGRRWVKFAKYLKRTGVKVKIVAAQEYLPGKSNWLKDAEELKADLFFTDPVYPKYLGLHPNSIFEKIAYRFSRSYAEFRNKGNYYDKSARWKKNLIKQCSLLMQQYKFNAVICTVPPFHMAAHLLELKRLYPQLKFIIDYRDPWSNNKTSFGFSELSAIRLNQEIELEKEVVNAYDKIITVSPQMQEYLQGLLRDKNSKSKFSVVPNGYDAEDFLSETAAAHMPTFADEINVVFAGTFYDKADMVLMQLFNAIDQLKSKNLSCIERIKFSFIGSINTKLVDEMQKRSVNFEFLGRKTLQETYAYLRAADYCALFLTDDLNYSFSTKFYEYIALNKAVLTFSRVKGANASYVESKGIGYALDFENMEVMLEKLASGKLPKIVYPTEVVSEFNVATLAKQIEALIER